MNTEDIATKENIRELCMILEQILALLQKQTATPVKYYSIKQVREMFDVSNETLTKWHVNNKQKQHKPGGAGSRKIFYLTSEVDNFVLPI